MNQARLYASLEAAGCTVLVFEDHPGFFGNWRASFTRGGATFHVDCDQRDGWMTLWRAGDGGDVKLDEVRLGGFGEDALLAELQARIARASRA